MAEENLGTAVLRIVVDDDQARATLDKLKSDIREVQTGVNRTSSTRTSSRTSSGPSSPGGLQSGSISRQDVSRFNLRGFIASLQSIADDLNNVATARSLNINSSWTAALATLSEVQQDLQTISAGKKLNIDSSWTAALTTLSEVQQDLQGIAAAKKLNIDANWTAALTTLSEVQQDLQGIAAAKKLNIDANWTAALTTLSEVQQDLQGIAAAKKLNLDSSWNAALQELQQVQLDLQSIAATKRINIKSSWAKALDFLDETAQIISDTGRQREVQEGLRVGRENVSPIRGGTAFPGSPAAIEAEKALANARRRSAETTQRAASAEAERTRKETARRRADVASNALIGGAFPLLFGQGAGAALGGAVGGGAGGLLGGQFGFGGSLVGTALGAALDAAIEKTKTLAQALDTPVKNFDALKEAALLSSKSVEKNAESLILAGRTQEAAVLIQEDLQRTFGNTENAERLIKANDELNRAWTEVSTATAFFVAGPLAEFLEKLRERITPPETETEAQTRAAEQSRLATTFKNVGLGVATLGLGVSASGIGVVPGLATAGVGGILAGIGTTIERQPRPRVPAQGDPVKQEQLRIAAAQEYQNILKKENQLIVVQAQGYDGIAASLERQLIIARAAAAKKDDPIQALKIEQDAQKELNKLAERELERKQAIQVQASLEAAQNKLKSQSIAEQITATQALGKAERGVARDTLATTQAIQLGINEARRREQEIGAQIDAARQRGGDAGEQDAARLVNQQVIAANETRLELEKGALALTEAGEQLRDSLRNAIVDFTRIRSDPQGLNRFLNPQQQDLRARQDFQTLLPQFREAQGRFTQLTGARAPEFSGSTASVNASIRDFINATQTEDQATRDLIGTQQALATNLEAYNSTLAQLATVTQTLADKNWAVNVAVSGAQSAISGDVLNGAVSP